MRGRSFSVPVIAALAALLFGGCGACGGGRSSSRDGASSGSGSTPPSDAIQITGRERIGWFQSADTLDNHFFAMYVDGARNELSGATCRPSQGGVFECDSPLPPLTQGVHTLEMVAWIAADGRIVESPKAPPVRVFVTPSAQMSAEARLVFAAPPAADASAVKTASSCGLSPRSEREVVMWTDAGEIDVFDRTLNTSRDLAWTKLPGTDWRMTGLATHPSFAQNKLVYVSGLRNEGDASRLFLARYREVGDVLGQRAVLLETKLPIRAQRTRMSFGANGDLYIALLDSPESVEASARRGEHQFVLHVTEDGRVPRDSAGSIFDRFTATAPTSIAWPADRRSPLVVDRARGGFGIVSAARADGGRLAVNTEGTPVAMQMVDTTHGPALAIVSSGGQLSTFDPRDDSWRLRSQADLKASVTPVNDALVFGDGELVACGPSGTGTYGIWRGRPPL